MLRGTAQVRGILPSTSLNPRPRYQLVPPVFSVFAKGPPKRVSIEVWHYKQLEAHKPPLHDCIKRTMEIDVGGEEHNAIESVETVEVVASGDDLPVEVSTVGGGLMDHQHMIISNPEGILVPTSEVRNGAYLS